MGCPDLCGILINIGERAGSGVPDIFSVWEQEGWQLPEVEEEYGPDTSDGKISEKISEKISG